MNIFNKELDPCPACGGNMRYFKSAVSDTRHKKYRDYWICDDCRDIEWQEKTEWVMNVERGPDIEKALTDLKKAQDEMFETIASLVRPVTEVKNHK